MKPYLAIAFLISLMFSSCNEDEAPVCTETPEEVWSVKLSLFEGYASCALKDTSPSKKEVHEIIQTKEEFDALNTCSIANHRVNFDYYTVLAGRIKAPGGGRVMNQWVTKDCNKLTFHVEIGWGSGIELSNVN